MIYCHRGRGKGARVSRNQVHCPVPRCAYIGILDIEFLDVERANGRRMSDPIQIGLLKWNTKTQSISDEIEVNVLPKDIIDQHGTDFLHGISLRGNTLYKKGQGFLYN